MRIAIYGKAFKDNFIDRIAALIQQLQERNCELIIFEPFYTFLSARIEFEKEISFFNKYEDIKDHTDLFFSIGGDGTMLDSITFIRGSQIPILGINTGRLGFLSNVAQDEIRQSIDLVLNKRYKIEKRSLLKLSTNDNLFEPINFALNELTVHKKDSSSMITIHAYINDKYLNSYWADGLIVATPTGSTAYSLSCGGPILVPEAKNFIINPIAPHNLNVRPVVVPDDITLTLKVEGRGDEFLASLDSRSEVIHASQELRIKKAGYKINLIQPENQNFFTTIRNKMMWGIDRRN